MNFELRGIVHHGTGDGVIEIVDTEDRDWIRSHTKSIEGRVPNLGKTESEGRGR